MSTFPFYQKSSKRISCGEEGFSDSSNQLSEKSFGKLQLDHSNSKNNAKNGFYNTSGEFDDSNMERATLSWKNIDCFAQKKTKKWWGSSVQTDDYIQLLHNLSGVVTPGNLVALMGASGAGKTTLLNVLTCRTRNLGSLRINGTVKVNGVSMGVNIKRVSAYIEQTEYFYGNLTVREHLLYSATLRMGRSYSQRDYAIRVEEMLMKMGLMGCANQRIKSIAGIQGISGSECKLLSLASELIIDRPIIFCDEPTTGLDATMAATVVNMLQKIAQRGKTVLCTIHQPASHIFDKFNQIILLAEGRLAFQGTIHEAITFYAKTLHLPCRENYNPADHFIHNLAIRPGEEKECKSKIVEITSQFQSSTTFQNICNQIDNVEKSNLANSFQNREMMFNNSINKESESEYSAKWFTQVHILIWKQLLDQYRNPRLFTMRIIQCFLQSAIIAVVFFQPLQNQAGIFSTNSAMYILILQLTNMAIIQINEFNNELTSYFKDHQNGLYRTDAFFISKNISEIPIFVIIVGVSSTLMYWCVGLYPGAFQFLFTICVYAMVYHASLSILVYTIVIITERTDVALSLVSPLRITLNLLSGYWANAGTIGPPLSWLRYISWHWYSYRLLVVTRWQLVDDIDCSASQAQSGCFTNGDDVIHFLSFESTDFVVDTLFLLGLVIAFRILPLVILIFKSRDKPFNHHLKPDIVSDNIS